MKRGCINEILWLTRGHKTLGTKWLFELHFSYQSSLYHDSDMAPKTQPTHICEPL